MTNTWAHKVESLSPEMKLLLALLAANKDQNIFPLEDPEAWKQINWDLFMELSVHHRVYPYLYRTLKKFNSQIPARVIRQCYDMFTRNTFQMLRFTGEMESIGTLLAQNGIRCLFLKGTVIAKDLYGDVSLRTSCDLDMLVPGESLFQAEALLLKLGYVKDDYIRTVLNDWKWRHHHFVYVHPAKGLKVEIHWRLNPAPASEPSFEQLWERRRTSSLVKQPIYYLGKEDLFLFLVMHGARHGWSRIRWLLDISRFLQQAPDSDRLIELLKAHHATYIGGQALALAAELLSTPIDSRLQPLQKHEKSQKLALEAMFYVERIINLHSGHLPREEDSYHKRHQFALLEPSRKALFIMGFLFPYPEDADVLPLPRMLHFLYVPLRPVLWAWRKIGGLR